MAVNPSEHSAEDLREMAFEAAGNPKREKVFLDLLSKQPLAKQTDFERIMAQEFKPLAKAAVKTGILGGAAKLAGKAAAPIALALGVADVASAVMDAKKKANEEADAAERLRREDERKKETRQWAKGLVRFSDAMQMVNENVSQGSEVDAVKDALEPLILSQAAPRAAQPLKFPTVFPSGRLERYIMRRIGGDDDMPVPAPLPGELVPMFSGGDGFPPPPPLQVELKPVTKGNAPKVTTSERSKHGDAGRTEKAEDGDTRQRAKAKGSKNGAA